MNNHRFPTSRPTSGIHREFLRRAGRIPFLGVGLSVDVYSPDIFALNEELRQQQIPIAYLELFHAAPEALEVVQTKFSHLPLAYHAEGLWFAQPDWETKYFAQRRLEAAARNLRILKSPWVNQECATKEMAGFAFGTYLPPLFTQASAETTACHAWKAQQALDHYDWGRQKEAPLLLLECPPLSYFSMGDVSYADFFSMLAAMAPCGLVLDLGHVWTVYRYTGAWRRQSLFDFFDTFLEQFPLERVIQIHIAGLACHPNIPNRKVSQHERNPPLWIDAHEASVPEELFDLLVRVVQEPRLMNLKGIALEVDNKRISLICQEIRTLIEKVDPVMTPLPQGWESVAVFQPIPETPERDRTTSTKVGHLLNNQNHHYVEFIRSAMSHRPKVEREYEEEGLEESDYYFAQFLPYEILSWGGDVREMFPQACRLLDQQAIPLNRFVDFWFAYARTSAMEYDFFLLKIRMFVDFLEHVLPCAHSIVKQEADLLAQGYRVACQRISL